MVGACRKHDFRCVGLAHRRSLGSCGGSGHSELRVLASPLPLAR